MHYLISIADTKNHFIQLQYTISDIHQDFIEVQLPAWRPGRYELQNFAKNIRCFAVSDSNGRNITYKKVTKDRWHIETKGIHKIVISYQYYANQPDAGACFVDENYLYINPVHCFLYVIGREDEEYILDFTLPNDYEIATQMTVSKPHQCKAPNFDYLTDSPLIASNTLQRHLFEVESTEFHIWFQGKHPFDVERLIADTTLYCKKQIELFGSIACSNYHFLYLIHPVPARHGVEHLDSTVIAMGKQDNQTVEEFYNDLLAISSHELFHLWNIKRIRPEEMLPYDFTKENYSTLGYVYEGVTTYYGDLMLLESGVWNWEQYAHSFNSDLLRHTSNPGRFNYSVAESSWDTWLDGYVSGVLGRKVSIYIEGMLAALIADLTIITNSKGKYRLHHVMHDLYTNYALHNKGYTEEIYKQLLEKYAGCTMDDYFEKIIWGKGYIQETVNLLLKKVGCELKQNITENWYIHNNETKTNEQKLLFQKWTGIM